MYLTQKCQIRDLSKQEFLALRELCRLSKNLYNVGLYSVRQFYFSEQKYLRYESNYHQCKDNENYKLLNTDIAQQTLKEESYTSQASFLDGDDIPTYNPDPSQKYQFSGKRVKRGLYCSKQGHLINADCNGAANIGKKSSHNGFTGVGRGCLTQPLRVKIS
jgi:transposase